MSALNQFNYPIYNYAVGWFNRQAPNPLDFIAPALSVDGATGTVKRYPQGYAFRQVDTRRAPYTEAHIVDVLAEDVPYLLEDHSLRIGVDDSEIKPGAGNKKEAADQIALAKTGSLLATWRTSSIAAGLAYFRKQVEAKSGKGAWSGVDADPIKELRELLADYEAANGVLPNRFLFSSAAWNTLCENAAVADLVAYNDAKVLTPALLFKLLHLTGEGQTAPQFLKATVPVGVHRPGAEVPFTGSNALGSDVWVTYVDEGQQIGDMCGMRQLHAGGESPVENVESYYNRDKKTTFYEVGLHRAFAVTAPSCNIRLAIS